MAIAPKLSQALNALKTLIYQRTKVRKDEVEDIANTAYLNNEINVDLTPTIQALTEPDLTPTKVFARSFINERKIAELKASKVDKIAGMSLSTNDYTDADKLKLDTMASDRHYQHIQMASSAVWTIDHNLGKYPSVVVFDSFNMEVIGEINHISNNQLTITYSGAFSGTAYLN